VTRILEQKRWLYLYPFKVSKRDWSGRIGGAKKLGRDIRFSWAASRFGITKRPYSHKPSNGYSAGNFSKVLVLCRPEKTDSIWPLYDFLIIWREGTKEYRSKFETTEVKIWLALWKKIEDHFIIQWTNSDVNHLGHLGGQFLKMNFSKGFQGLGGDLWTIPKLSSTCISDL